MRSPTLARFNFLQRGGVKDHDRLLRAGDFFLSQLLPSSLVTGLVLRVEIRAYVDKPFVAQVHSPPEGAPDQGHHLIQLTRSRDSFDLLEDLAHELVHVAQHRSGRLVRRMEVDWWEGAPVSPSVPYEKKPWEVEAYAKESHLAWQFLKVEEGGSMRH